MEKKVIKKTRVGFVVSDKMDKTVVVEVSRQFKHSLYGKIVRTRKRYKAHDEDNQCIIGDQVEIVETRHYSKDKYWCVSKVISRAEKMVG